MIELKKFKQRLDTIDVFLDDPLSGTGEARYFHIVDFPDIVSRGKTSFLVGGTPFLKKSTVLKVEALDANGEPIFVEPIDATYSEAGYKPISIVSYGGEAPGLCKLIIVAEIENYLGGDTGLIGTPVPDNWKGVYNVRWTQEFFLDNTTHLNVEPIRFVKHPSITAEELISPYVTISGSIGDATFTDTNKSAIVYGIPGNTYGGYDGYVIGMSSSAGLTTFKTEHEGGIITIPAHNTTQAQIGSVPTDMINDEPNHAFALAEDLELQIVKVVNSNMALVKGLGNIPGNSPSNFNHFQSESVFEYPIYQSAGVQNNNGQILAVRNNADGTQTNGYFPEDEVLNNPPPPYWTPILFSNPETRFARFHSHFAHSATGSVSIEYISASYSETQTLKSYAKISIKDLKTYSGDVHSLKLYVKPSSQAQEMMIAEGKLEDEKKFILPVGGIDPEGNQIINFDVGAGKFVSQNFVNAAFSASLHQTPGFEIYASGVTSSQPTLSFDESIIFEAMKVSGSIQGMGDFYQIKSIPTMSFQAGQEYTIKFHMHAKKDMETEFSDDWVSSTSASKAKAHIYMSGSAFDDNHQLSVYSNIDANTFPDSITPGALRSQYSGKRVFGYRMSDDITQTYDLSDVGTQPLYFENNFLADNTGDGKLVIYIEAGEFVFNNIEVNVAKETGFNPSEYTFNVPIAKEIEDDVLTFGLEMFTANGEPAILENDVLRLQSVPTDFSGGNLVIDGESNLIVGSTFISNVAGSGIELAGVNSGFIRSVGYEGFISASTGKASPGFLLFSGSILPDTPDNYVGIGLELHAGADSGSMKFHARGAESTFEVITPSFLLGKEAAGFSFISGSNGKIEISSSNFHLSESGDVAMAGTVTAQDGIIGGFVISGSTLSGSNITLDSSASALFMSNQPDEYFIDFTPGAGVGEVGSNRADSYVKFGPNFAVRNDGILVASGAKIEGVLTSSLGQIANWNIVDDSIHKLSGGTYSGLSSGGDTRFFAGASALNNSGSAPFNVKADGTITSSKGLIGDWSITSRSIEKVGEFELSPGGDYVISSSNFKVDNIGKISASAGLIGGFEITDTFISGGNLIMHNQGRIESADFSSGVSGWRISAEDNGTAEFENATIRGTLSTTTFEKESVNAVGGQLYVANSTALTGSVSASQVTMSVVNVTGFSENEVLLIKKTTDTGFNTEYVRIISSSRSGTDDNDLVGKIMVERGYSGSVDTGQTSSSLGDSPNSAVSYTEGQIIASTGKVGTGFMRLNANPNDETTPYMDIVERTGSAIYDVDLKVRLGDLSGLSQTQLLGTNPSNAGFGLYSENVFLSGGISATYGNIGGFGISSNVLSGSDFFLSGSASENETFLSASNLDIKASGDITSSNALFNGTLDVKGQGTIAGWTLAPNEISSGSGLEKISIESITGSLSAFDSNGVKRVFVGIKDLSSPSASTNILFNPGFQEDTVSTNQEIQLTGSLQATTITGWHVSASGEVYGGTYPGAVTASLVDSGSGQFVSFHFDSDPTALQNQNPGAN